MRLNETELGDCFGVNVVEATLKGHGAPEIVLRIAKRKFKIEELGTDDVLARVIARPIILPS